MLLIRLEIYLLTYSFLLSFYYNFYATKIGATKNAMLQKTRGFYGNVNTLANEV